MENVLSGVKRIHLVGIGGVGMAGLALLLREKGFAVSGSDIAVSYTTEILARAGCTIFSGHARAHVEGADLLCFSSAIRNDNPELIQARALGIMTCKRGYILALLSAQTKAIAVAGSHGKTTTSALTAFMLSKLGYSPYVFIGGLPLNFDTLAWSGRDFFVAETDESDGTFLFFKPWVSIITNIDREHLDFYKNIEKLKSDFKQFARQTQSLVIGCGDEPNVRFVASGVPHITYGFAAHNDIRAENIIVDKGSTVFDLLTGEKRIKGIRLSLVGEHNVLNALAVVCLCAHLGKNIEDIVWFLEEFKGVKRRFQVTCKIGGVQFIDDYAHHPREIAAVLKAARLLAPARLVAVFQPHRYSRVKSLGDEFARAFDSCDCLIVTDIYAAGETAIKDIDARFLCSRIRKRCHKPVLYVPHQDLAREVSRYLQDNDFVIGLGAGDINLLMDDAARQFAALSEKRAVV